MAANVLNSARAVAMSVEVVRAFVLLRKVTLSHDSLKMKLGQLEEAVRTRLDSHDAQVEELFDTVESLIEGNAEASRKKQIGFVP